MQELSLTTIRLHSEAVAAQSDWTNHVEVVHNRVTSALADCKTATSSEQQACHGLQSLNVRHERKPTAYHRALQTFETLDAATSRKIAAIKNEAAQLQQN